jgi:hypothetical protein
MDLDLLEVRRLTADRPGPLVPTSTPARAHDPATTTA